MGASVWLTASSVSAQTGSPPAADVTAPQMSPMLTWDPFRDTSRPPTKRPLTTTELARARDRATAFFDLLKAIPIFNANATRVTLAGAWPVVDDSGAISEQIYVYWSKPGDVRRRADGSFLPKMGGAHEILFVDTNHLPGANHLEDRATRGNFSRGVENSGLPDGVFVQPRVFGQIGGGTLYATNLVLTRDGRPPLEPAPLGVLLDDEIARYRQEIAALDQGTKRSLEQLEASMTDAAKADRRARRADRWKPQYPNPDALTRELDNADKSDEADYQRQKERLTPPAMRDPKSVYWGPRLALEALEQRASSLTPEERAGGACGRLDPAFNQSQAVRYEPVATAGSSCVPMVRIRRDLVDPRRPAEVQMVNFWFSESLCGEHWAGTPSLRDTRCDAIVPFLRQFDWTAFRKTLGW